MEATESAHPYTNSEVSGTGSDILLGFFTDAVIAVAVIVKVVILFCKFLSSK